jgi:hypothetical protein
MANTSKYEPRTRKALEAEPSQINAPCGFACDWGDESTTRNNDVNDFSQKYDTCALHVILADFGRLISSVIRPSGNKWGPAARHTRAAAGQLCPVYHHASNTRRNFGIG